MIKAVLFDVDGVLLGSFEANLNFFRELLPKAGYSAPSRETYTQMFHMTMRDVIKKLVEPAGDTEAERVYQMGQDYAINYLYQKVKSPDKMDETIFTLSRKYKLGIVTSRISTRIIGYPQFANIKQCFETIVCFQDTKEHKPHPAPLLLAAKRLGVSPLEAVYIGDAETDRQAAQSAKMSFIMYSNTNPKSPQFAELPQLIAKINCIFN